MSPITDPLSTLRLQVLAKAKGDAESRESREGPDCVAHRLSRPRRAEPSDPGGVAPLHHQEESDGALARPSLSALASAAPALSPVPAESVQACHRCSLIVRCTLHEVIVGLRPRPDRLVWLCPRCLDAVEGRWPDIPVAPGNYYGD